MQTRIFNKHFLLTALLNALSKPTFLKQKVWEIYQDNKTSAYIKVILIMPFFSFLSYTTYAQVKDAFTPLPANAIHLHGYLENDIQNSIAHWNKGVVPYAGFVKTFRDGRTYFAEGEMWGKAVRSGCMF